MWKRLFKVLAVGGVCLAMTACQPSEEKIGQAQERYAQLAEVHNQVVEAHGNVADDSLDQELTALQSKARELEGYNLAEMKDEEIDQLIQTMDSLIEEYGAYLTALSDIRGKEEAAVITPITLALTNNTELSVSGLALYEKGDVGSRINILESMEPLLPQQSLTGLIIQRDVDNTPWILALTDSEGREFEIELSVGEYDEEGVSLTLDYDGEQGQILARS